VNSHNYREFDNQGPYFLALISRKKPLKRLFAAIQFLTSFEKNFYLILIAASILIVLIVFRDVRTVIFQMISAFTTTGYSITNIVLLPQLFILMLMVNHSTMVLSIVW